MAHYQLIEVIGGGGFADVWRAIRQDTREEVAVKMLRDYLNSEARHRFAREVRMIQGLRHRRVIRMIEANVDATQPFYVMPLMKGGALTRWAGNLPAPTVRGILTELADFLTYLHEQGGFHRDIKPDNLLVDSAGQFAVGDFGLGNNPRYTVMFTAHAAGTWGYVAPELTKPGAQVTAASDIYSLGASLFHLLTGMHPAQAAALDPWMYRRDIPVDLRNLVVQMVHPDPKCRPSARWILQVLAPQQVPKPQVAPAQSDSSSGDFWKALLGIGGVAAVLALVAAAASDSRRG